MVEVTETARRRVQKLVEDWDWPAPAILEDIVALGEEAVPALAELLTPERLAEAEDDEQADALVYYAMELLAALGTPTAIPIFADAYRQVSDDIVEGMENALRRLGPDAIDALLALAADPNLTWYARALVANGAVHEAGDDPARRAQVGAGLRAVVASYMERPEPPTEEEREVIGSFIADLSELADPEAYSLIRAAFDADRVLIAPRGGFDLPLITWEGVEELYQEGGRSSRWEPKPFADEYRERRQTHLEDQEKKARLALLEPEPTSQPVVLGRKIGRNDPCWCGSGQKYKKCHLAQDEKEKVRL